METMKKPVPQKRQNLSLMFGALSAIAAFGLRGVPGYEPQERPRRKNPAKPGGNAYMPAGERRNVTGTRVRNPKVAAQMNAMHAKWVDARAARAAAADLKRMPVEAYHGTDAQA